jgi:hypothetical protein
MKDKAKLGVQRKQHYREMLIGLSDEDIFRI